jgi:hypothetical protein
VIRHVHYRRKREPARAFPTIGRGHFVRTQEREHTDFRYMVSGSALKVIRVRCSVSGCARVAFAAPMVMVQVCRIYTITDGCNPIPINQTRFMLNR